MPSKLESLIKKIRSIANEYCENQMYVWPGFDPDDPDPEVFFRKQRIEFDGDLFIRYPVKKTFRPIPPADLDNQERTLGITLPNDYKQLLQTFGPLHLPGDAGIIIESPADALKTTRHFWCYEGTPLSVLAISGYNDTSDGNGIGFIRNGDSFEIAVYRFDHELRYKGDDPALWSSKLGNSLTEFLIDYLAQQF